MLKGLAFVVLLLVSGATAAQALEPVIPVRPMNTALFVPSESGSGWLIDVFPSGLVFGAHYTYGPDGQTAWLILQGDYVANTEADRLRTGILGRASSQLFEGRNGPCFGCNYVPPSIVPSTYGSGELVWFNTGRAEFRWNGQTKALSRVGEIQAASTSAAIFKNKWRVSRIQRSGNSFSEVDEGIVRFQNRTLDRAFVRDARPDFDPLIPIPQDNWQQFEIVCTPPAGSLFCVPSFAAAQPLPDGRVGAYLFYQDPNTLDIHYINVCDNTSVPNCANLEQGSGGQLIVRGRYNGVRGDVLIVSTDVLVIRSSFGGFPGQPLSADREWVLRKVYQP